MARPLAAESGHVAEGPGFQRWLQQDRRNPNIFAEMKATSRLLDDLRRSPARPPRPRSKRRRVGPTLALLALTALPAAKAETLYNGIELPAPWPPRNEAVTAEPPETPPYLASPPDVVPIDVGRQLFVDYFLIEDTTLRRTFHPAEPYSGNPILKPDKPWESTGLHGTAMPFSDGVWYDPQDRYFKAWYCGGGAYDWYLPGTVPYTLFARSIDGVHMGEARTRRQARHQHRPGRSEGFVDCLWLDQAEKDPSRRFKFLYSEGAQPGKHNDSPRAKLYFSADGIHWGNEVLRTPPHRRPHFDVLQSVSWRLGRQPAAIPARSTPTRARRRSADKRADTPAARSRGTTSGSGPTTRAATFSAP